VISASTDNIEIMHQVLAEHANAAGIPAGDLKPDAWLPTFYERRKGSGKGRPSSPAGANQTTPRRTAAG